MCTNQLLHAFKVISKIAEITQFSISKDISELHKYYTLLNTTDNFVVFYLHVVSEAEWTSLLENVIKPGDVVV